MPLPKPNRFETSLEIYKTKDILGEGGSGRVFLVRDSKGNDFAIKCLFPELAAGDRLRRFKNELLFSQKNTHPNILSILDHGFLAVAGSKAPFYVMPVYPSTLRKLMTAGLPPDRAYELFLKMLDGIEEAHQRKIWHRDLKPENVLVDLSASTLVIADFGIAHFSELELHTAVKTSQSERLANFQYAAPEQRTQGQTVDQRADVYALGLILSEMFTGVIPLGTSFKPVSAAVPAFSYLDKVIDRMIRQSPDKRPSSINEIRLELTLGQQAYLSSKPTLAKRTSGSPLSGMGPTYRAEVDSVGRIDDVKNNTVLSISAGLSYSIMIPATEKQRVLTHVGALHPRWGSTRRYVYVYTILLFALIKDHVRKLDVVVVDPEYPGYEPQIKDMLLRLLRGSGLHVTKSQIAFERIDRSSPARQMASKVFKGSAEPDAILGAKQIVDLAK